MSLTAQSLSALNGFTAANVTLSQDPVVAFENGSWTFDGTRYVFPEEMPELSFSLPLSSFSPITLVRSGNIKPYPLPIVAPLGGLDIEFGDGWEQFSGTVITGTRTVRIICPNGFAPLLLQDFDEIDVDIYDAKFFDQDFNGGNVVFGRGNASVTLPNITITKNASITRLPSSGKVYFKDGYIVNDANVNLINLTISTLVLDDESITTIFGDAISVNLGMTATTHPILKMKDGCLEYFLIDWSLVKSFEGKKDYTVAYGCYNKISLTPTQSIVGKEHVQASYKYENETVIVTLVETESLSRIIVIAVVGGLGVVIAISIGVAVFKCRGKEDEEEKLKSTYNEPLISQSVKDCEK
jgi:hypothetical protein